MRSDLPDIVHIQRPLLFLSEIPSLAAEYVISAGPEVDLIWFISTVLITFITEDILLKILHVIQRI